tara:strand:+ start:759 stop:2708 length:1950 start_codon:yes stop_codon:yes gene_type:complete
MADKNQIILELKAKTTKLEADLKKVEKALDGVENKTKKAAKEKSRLRIATEGARRSLGAIRNNLLLVTFAFGGSLAAVNKLIQAYGQQELAERKLRQALGFTSKALLAQSSALQQQTTFGDEAIIAVQSLIGAFTKDEEQIKALTIATLDLASAKGMDLTAAADLVSKSFGSSTNALSRYGIQVEGAVGSTERLQNLTGNVAALFGGQASAEADTMTGSIQQMQNAIGDTAETMGRVFAPATIQIAKHMKNAAEGVSEFFTRLVETPLETTIREMSALGLETKELALILAQVRAIELEAKSPRERFEIEQQMTEEIDNQKDILLERQLLEQKLNDLGLAGVDLRMAEAKAFNTAKDEFKGISVFEIQRLRIAQEKFQSEKDGHSENLKALAEELKLATELELIKQQILDLEGETFEIRNRPIDQGDTGDLFKDFEEFEKIQDKKLEKYQQEQDMIAMLVEQNPLLAESLGLVTDEQKKQLEDSEKLTKVRKKEGMQFLQNLQSATKGQKEFSGIFKAAAITETTITTAQAVMAAYKAMAGIPVVGPALGVAAGTAAGLAGAAQIKEITAAQYGMNEVVDQPTMILAGEAGAEQVSITPLEGPNIDGVQGGGASVVVNVSGNVLTSDFVEGELADNIREAVRRGTDFGIG